MTFDQKENIGFATQAGAKQLFLRYGVGFLINVAGTIVIARKGGPALWGLFAVSQVVLTIFAVLSHGCWGYLIQNKSVPDRQLIGNCYTLQTLISVSWAVIILALSSFLSDRLSSKDLFPLLLATVFGGFFYGWRYVICGLSERNLQYGTAAAAELSDILVFNSVAVALALFGYPYYGILAGNIFRGVVSTFVAHRRARQNIYFLFERSTFKRVARFSFPFSSFIALQWLPIYAGPVVAGSFLTVRELGILQLAYKTVEYPRVVVTIAFRLSMSVFARAGQTVEEIRQSTQKVVDFLFFLLVPAMIILVGVSPLWVPFVYGAAWLKMTSVMGIIVFPYLIMALMMILSSLQSARGNAKASFTFYAIYNCFYWSSLIIMVTKIGFYGAPVAEWIALIGCTVLLLELRSTTGILKIVIKYIIILSVVSGAVLFLGQVALYRSLLQTVVLGSTLIIVWFLFSPAKKEMAKWLYQHRVPAADQSTVLKK